MCTKDFQTLLDFFEFSTSSIMCVFKQARKMCEVKILVFKISQFCTRLSSYLQAILSVEHYVAHSKALHRDAINRTYYTARLYLIVAVQGQIDGYPCASQFFASSKYSTARLQINVSIMHFTTANSINNVLTLCCNICN